MPENVNRASCASLKYSMDFLIMSIGREDPRGSISLKKSYGEKLVVANNSEEKLWRKASGG